MSENNILKDTVQIPQNGYVIIRIKLDNPGSLRVRRDSMCDRSEIRLILQQRVTQRIRERSMEAVIMEARTQLQRETRDQDVYVPLDFNKEREMFKDNNLEEDLYMTMS